MPACVRAGRVTPSSPDRAFELNGNDDSGAAACERAMRMNRLSSDMRAGTLRAASNVRDAHAACASEMTEPRVDGHPASLAQAGSRSNSGRRLPGIGIACIGVPADSCLEAGIYCAPCVAPSRWPIFTVVDVKVCGGADRISRRTKDSAAASLAAGLGVHLDAIVADPDAASAPRSGADWHGTRA